MSYPFLVGELAKRSITKESLAKTLGLHRNAVSYKLKKGSFSIEEATVIQKEYFSDIPLTSLFKKD